MLEKLRTFLLGFPGWEEEPTIDFAEDGLGYAGLFFKDLEETDRQVDLIGNVQVEYACRFTLYRRMLPGQDSAQWLLDLESWVQQQNAAGLLPPLGDVPERERIRIQKGSLQEASRLGTGLCTVIVVAEFVKKFEVREV